MAKKRIKDLNELILPNSSDVLPIEDLANNETKKVQVANFPISTATQTALNSKASASALNSHIADINNPHSVTKTQVGLSNVDNTSDLNKPISTAVQTALNGKQDSLGYTPENVANKSISVTTDQASNTKYPSVKAVYDWATGLFATITQLGTKQDTITGAATTITSSNLGLSKAVVSDASGKIAASTTTSTEIGYVSGVTSAIQTQINGKQDALGFTPVTNARTLTINGTTYDLSANRTWSVGDLVSTGSYSNPTWLTSLAWGKITSTPTTLAGYGITDAVPSSRTLTINGTTYDLSADRTWTISTATPTLDAVTTAGNTTTNSISVGKITTNGSITASAALAQGSYFNNTLVAAANNDVLVGLDINPTITSGAFTGIKSYGLRIVGDNLAFQPSTTTKIPIFVTSNNNTRIIISSTATGTSFNTGFSLTQGSTYKWSFASYGTNADFVFYNDVTSTNSLFIAGNTNNVLINSTTDAGYKLDVNGTARVQTTLTAGQNSGTSYNHLFDAGLGGITFRRFDSYVTSNFITITQPNYSTSANGSMLYIDSPNITRASGFATLKLAGPYNGGGSTYLQVGNASTITSTHVSLAKFHTGNLQYIGPQYGGSNTFMGLDIRVEGQTADYSVSTTTNFVGIYVQSSFLNKYSTTQLPIGSWKTFVDNSTLTSIVTPFTSIDITPTFTSASNTVTSYGININPTLNGYTGFIALNVQQGKVITSSSITAASALAQGVYFNNTLVAAANNDVLVGLDINPTFTNGAFTGVSNIGIRVQKGTLRLASISSDPTTAANGDMYYNTTSNTFKVYQGGAWKTITAI